MNSFNTQLQIEDMYDQDEYAALLHYCECRETDQKDLEINEHWQNVWLAVQDEWADNQPKPF